VRRSRVRREKVTKRTQTHGPDNVLPPVWENEMASPAGKERKRKKENQPRCQLGGGRQIN